MKPKMVDLFCGAGGCAAGYSKYFDVVGVDIKKQPRYPFEFIQADARKFDISCFDFAHASPPCQSYTPSNAVYKKINPLKYWLLDFLPEEREKLILSGKPYVIENVKGVPLLINPLMLCGSMFGLGVVRHRYFESNIPLIAPGGCQHKGTVMNGDYASVVGNGGFGGGKSDIATWKKAMGIDWMTKNELTQAIPPAFTEWIGKQVFDFIVNVCNGQPVNNLNVNVPVQPAVNNLMSTSG